MKAWQGAAGLMLLALMSAPSHAAGWTSSWGAAPIAPLPAIGPFPPTPTFSNQTIRQVVHLSAGGSSIRVRFSNEYGSQPLLIGAARVALADAAGTVQAASEKTITFSGKSSATALIPAGSPLLSEPVDLAVSPAPTSRSASTCRRTPVPAAATRPDCRMPTCRTAVISWPENSQRSRP